VFIVQHSHFIKQVH